MAVTYPWAANQDKLNRASAWVGQQVLSGALKESTEAAIKARYVDLKGLLLPQAEDENTEDVKLNKLNPEQLIEYAGTNNIDVTGLTAKKDLIAAIEAAEATS